MSFWNMECWLEGYTINVILLLPVLLVMASLFPVLALVLAAMPARGQVTTNCTQPIPQEGDGLSDLQAYFSDKVSIVCSDIVGATNEENLTDRGYNFASNVASNFQNGQDDCTAALNSIITQCINNNFYGGISTSFPGIYQITNAVFPDDPLNPSGTIPTVTSPPQPTLDCNSFPADQINNGELWETLDVTSAVQALLDQGPFDTDPSSDNRLDLLAARTYGNIPNFRCGIQESGCTPVTCEEAGNNPIGQMILNSFANMHLVYLTMSEGLQNAAIDFDPGSIVRTLNKPPPDPTQQILKTVLDVVTALVGVGNAGAGFLVGVAKFAGKNTGKALDKSSSAISALISGGNAIAKDNLPEQPPPPDSDDEVSALFSQTIMGFQTAMNNYATQLLTLGTVSSTNPPSYASDFVQNGQISVTVADVFDNGTLLTNTANSKTIQDFTNYYSKLINAITIDQFWFANECFVFTGDSAPPNDHIGEPPVVFQHTLENGTSIFVITACGGDASDPVPNMQALDGTAFGGFSIDDWLSSCILCNQLNPEGVGRDLEDLAFFADDSGDSFNTPFALNVRSACLMHPCISD
ncbi:hypothetical protein B7463_g10740, partial [Scytalidium lignicola]